MKTTVDSRGRVIFFTEPNNKEVEKAYLDCDFVTIEKEDVKNLISILSEIIDERGLISPTDQRSISYERLIDRADGLCYNYFLNKYK